MTYSDLRWSRTHVELAMDIATVLADMSQNLESCARIPAYLSGALDLEPLTLAIMVDEPNGPRITFQASAGPIDPSAPEFTQNLLAIHQQTRPLAPADGPTLRHEGSDVEGPAEMALVRPGQFPRATVLSRPLDADHRMLLVLHQQGEDAALSAGLIDLLQLVADKLAKLLSCQVAWRTQSEVGEPFSRLTNREWAVLQGLSSDAGEKQLADELGLSPHTLHSHIKSIYRKVGVQGRLLLLAKVNKSMRDLRSARIANTKRSLVAPTEKSTAVFAS